MHEEITRRILAAMDDADVKVTIDGNRATIEVVSSHFADMSRVRKQQAVYAFVQDYIADGTLHAVTIKADAP
jgi:acid stress-induced BolA-like protein IbaG/YrbA